MQYRKDKHGDELSILGFGCMRFTKKGGGIDIDKAEQEIMEAYRAGVNYFDTAYIYSGSEAAIGEIFERNGIRDKVKIATKLPQYLINAIFPESIVNPCIYIRDQYFRRSIRVKIDNGRN